MKFSYLVSFALVLGWNSEVVMTRNAVHTVRHDIAFVHTFDTKEMCMSRCRIGCTQQHSEDLMMPRWHCPLQEEDENDVEEEEKTSLGGKMLIIVPCVIFGSLLFLFFCVSAMQRFCRNDY
ncbi:Protein CBG14087 [Caenorhabditis briggsae]|uniref:Uncharacterized protein n=2 Tax=Caenorhabditis briggsae TaxID=6238 RepID=A0AAE9FFA2_CAEBR|nr:Protein CBG14087 [Caenorhabditis briggsae]ULT81607.1 hypothetical protein L3Y34_011531 [Caenorhabditis briggsae]UMM40920.1 hypothetical protein L5515_017407 [Caenorhabditis briggsae]CAP32739.1 Protein CBG14087 [Caenorhabditis briggsae]